MASESPFYCYHLNQAQARPGPEHYLCYQAGPVQISTQSRNRDLPLTKQETKYSPATFSTKYRR
jgi:hypothetical protein